MTGLWTRVKSAYRWLVSDDDTLVDLSIGFTVVTVVNSAMMVAGHDTPKLGTFAYVHLLLRLSIIFGALLLWDSGRVIADLKKYRAAVKRLPQLRPGDMIRWGRALPDHPFSSACMLFTGVVVLLSLAHILVVPGSTGGPALYLGLIWLFAVIYGGLLGAAVLCWMVLR